MTAALVRQEADKKADGLLVRLLLLCAAGSVLFGVAQHLLQDERGVALGQHGRAVAGKQARLFSAVDVQRIADIERGVGSVTAFSGSKSVPVGRDDAGVGRLGQIRAGVRPKAGRGPRTRRRCG